MKNRVLKLFLFSLEMIFSCLFLIISIMFIYASFHNIKMCEDVKSFINKAEFEFKSENTYYYSVTDYSLEEETIKIKEYNADVYYPVLGKTGDLFLMPQSRMEYIPLFSSFVSTLFGGHAGVIIDDGDRLIEAMGGSKEQSYVFNFSTDLYTEERTVIGMRVKASQEERHEAANNAISLVGKSYNHWFIFNTKDAYYCTDICARVYGKEYGMDYKLENNGFHTSVQDLFHSEDTYITFVKYKKGNETHIYYLKNPNLEK